MNITQLINNNGNAVKNQFVIHTDEGMYFKSYNSLIAFKPSTGCSIVLTSDWDYSVTTLKHLKTFLCTDMSKAQIQKEIDNGGIILDDNLLLS
jgi:hypothetical protein